jgi:thiamine pyrophosphate-dependent acetolactate synthase large subunit-like protein
VAADLIGQADCVIAFGASLNPYTTKHQQLFRNAVLVQCDLDDEALVQYGRPEVAVRGDALAIARGLLDLLEPDEPSGAFRAAADAAGVDEETWRPEIDDVSSEGALDPRAICRRLDALLPRERTIVVDSGGISEHPPPQMTVPSPEALLWVVGDFGAIGTGLAPAIGAAIGRPDRVTVAIIGDGGLFLTLPELDLAVRERIPLLVVCLNDRAYGSEYHHIVEDGIPEDTPGAMFETPDLAAVARAMGCEGQRITSLDQLDGAVARLEGLDRPLFLDCMLTQQLIPSQLRQHMRAPGL